MHGTRRDHKIIRHGELVDLILIAYMFGSAVTIIFRQRFLLSLGLPYGDKDYFVNFFMAACMLAGTV